MFLYFSFSVLSTLTFQAASGTDNLQKASFLGTMLKDLNHSLQSDCVHLSKTFVSVIIPKQKPQVLV